MLHVRSQTLAPLSRGPRALLCTIAILLLFVLAVPLVAQATAPARFSPPTPTSLDRIRARFGVQTAYDLRSDSTLVAGSVVRTTIHLESFSGLPPVFINTFADFGPLPAGTYTYEIYLRYPSGFTELRSSQPLVILDPPPPPVPTLSTLMIAVLATLLGVVGLFAIRRL